MVFDVGVFASALVGTGLAMVAAFKMINQIDRKLDDTRYDELASAVHDIYLQLNQLHAKVTSLSRDLEALKLDVAELHDALHESLADQRSEMEDWDGG